MARRQAGSGRRGCAPKDESYNLKGSAIHEKPLHREYAAIMKTRTAQTESGSGGFAWGLLALTGGLLAAGYALDCMSSRRCHKRTESMLDEALDETFPASDPTSTQDFSAPEDRIAAVS